MAFDITKPAGNDSVGSSAALIRENFRALLQDKFTQGSTTPSSATGLDGYLFYNTTEKVLYKKINGTWTALATTDVPDATSSVKGKMMLYTATGSATNGTMTQNAITTALAGKASTSDINTITTALAGKINTDHTNDTKPYLKTTYVNGTSGYNIWSNGYCEQWGHANFTTTTTITFDKTFNNANYNIQITFARTDNTQYDSAFSPNRITALNKTAEGFNLYSDNYSALAERDWKACGYLASGQY